MKKKRHSIKDIAKTLDVSATTISFVLNGKGKEKKISDEMIARVLAYTKEIGYKPNRVAQSLRTGETRVLVFMVEDISNHFFARVARIMEEIAYARGYRVLFCSNENKDERARDLINVFLERQVDGFILNPSPGIEREVAELVASDTPVILFDRFFPGLDTNYVVIDNYAASRNATKHLVDNGFRRIAFITTDAPQVQMDDRLRGYRDEVEERCLRPTVLAIPYLGTDLETSRQLIHDLLTGHEALDAVYFSTNYLTLHGLKVIKEVYGSMEAIGIVTFDDNDLFRINSPSITAVAQPLRELAEESMRILLLLLKNKRKDQAVANVQTVLQAELIPRESSMARVRS